MAVRDVSQQQDLSGLNAADTRIDAWLWFYLNGTGSDLGFDSFMAPGMRDLMANAIRSKPIWSQEQIAHEQGRLLLPDESLAWIVDDERQTKWLLSYFRDRSNFGISPVPPRLLGRNLLITSIDIWNVDLSTKSAAVSDMAHAWNQYKQSDHLFRWFKDVDEAPRCELAWAWLMEKKAYATFGKAPISAYDGLLIFFDELRVSDAEKKLDVDAIKKRWAQQQYRKKLKGKKQCNLLLSNQAMANLDKLAAKYEVSRSQILEALIQFETERSTYLPEKMRAIAWG